MTLIQAAGYICFGFVGGMSLACYLGLRTIRAMRAEFVRLRAQAATAASIQQPGSPAP